MTPAVGRIPEQRAKITVKTVWYYYLVPKTNMMTQKIHQFSCMKSYKMSELWQMNFYNLHKISNFW